MIKLTVEGQVYEFDQERLLLAEARQMKKLTGLTPPRWAEGIDEQDPDAIAMLVYMAKKRAGETLRFEDLDSLDYADIEMELVGEEEPAEGERLAQAVDDVRQAADPTPPSGSGTTPTDGTGATSPTSPTASSTTLTTSGV